MITHLITNLILIPAPSIYAAENNTRLHYFVVVRHLHFFLGSHLYYYFSSPINLVKSQCGFSNFCQHFLFTLFSIFFFCAVIYVVESNTWLHYLFLNFTLLLHELPLAAAGVTVCCSVLQCVAIVLISRCYSTNCRSPPQVLQCVLQCVAVCCDSFDFTLLLHESPLAAAGVAVCVAMCCSVLQRVVTA